MCLKTQTESCVHEVITLNLLQYITAPAGSLSSLSTLPKKRNESIGSIPWFFSLSLYNLLKKPHFPHHFLLPPDHVYCRLDFRHFFPGMP